MSKVYEALHKEVEPVFVEVPAPTPVLKIQCLDPRSKTKRFVRQTQGSAGIDLWAFPTVDGMENGYCTGIAVEIPEGYVGIVVPRSSAGKKGFTLKNTIGIIDSDYRGEIKLLLNKPICEATRIAQLIIIPYAKVDIQMTNILSDTDRGDGGFGSTGDK